MEAEMLETLLESRATRAPVTGAGAIAVGAHVVLLAIASLSAGLQAGPAPAPPRETAIFYAPDGPASTSARPTPDGNAGVPVAPTLPPEAVGPAVALLPGARVEVAGIPVGADAARMLAASPPSRYHAANGGFDAGSVLLAGEVDEPAAVLAARTPVYPRSLAAAGISGRVSLRFVVDTLGRCEAKTLRVVTSSHPGFEQAAIEAILATRFRPARARGRPVRQLVQQSVAFTATTTP
jgi:TonB family protein